MADLLGKLLGNRVCPPWHHDIRKLWPTIPPKRGDIVLVDDERCRVTYCRVRRTDAGWMIASLRVRPAPIRAAGEGDT